MFSNSVLSIILSKITTLGNCFTKFSKSFPTTNKSAAPSAASDNEECVTLTPDTPIFCRVFQRSIRTNIHDPSPEPQQHIIDLIIINTS